MNKRSFLQKFALAGASLWFLPQALFASPTEVRASEAEAELFAFNPQDFTLPALAYATDALEPHFDKMTMEIHHTKHHAAYVKNLNEAVKNTAWAGAGLDKILAEVTAKFPAIRNNAGGHYNHSLFWTLLSPQGGGEPTGKVGEAIKATFGSFQTFQEQFQKEALSRFGSGWVWLIVEEKTKKLKITSTPNQDNPLMKKLVKEQGTPILALDVWEHAYYLKYQNKRADFVKAFWNVVNWQEVNKLLG
jgi:Fe-Mn family superoxide dismutase